MNGYLTFYIIMNSLFVFFQKGPNAKPKKFQILTRNNILQHVQVAKVVENFMPKIMTYMTAVTLVLQNSSKVEAFQLICCEDF